MVELDLLPFDGCICLDSILTYLKQWRECWVVHRIADKGQGKKSDDGRVLWDRYGYIIPIPVFFQLKALGQSLVLHAANVVGITIY